MDQNQDLSADIRQLIRGHFSVAKFLGRKDIGFEGAAPGWVPPVQPDENH